jgi:hypothetical protein
MPRGSADSSRIALYEKVKYASSTAATPSRAGVKR